ncbi:MAG: sigma-70 family RNA polymerase sigma factor [Candidatus Fermentibacteraceae bacterium]|nr:sigma-70 family RNA polymerase sigma factor [Candidatus Fermentibacteraceae bacterium]
MIFHLVYFLTAGLAASEPELLGRAVNGDREAFGEIVKMYEKRVFRVARRMSNCDDDAWDITQEAFIKAMKAMHNFNTEYRFFTWMYRIVTNTAINMTRSRSRRGEVEFDEGYGGGGRTATADNAIQETNRDLLVQAVQKAVQRLTPALRSVFVLRVDQELSYEEIAETLGIATGTVMSRLNRARSSVKTFVVTELGGEP